MNRKGFVFTETIVAIVILTSALLLIYTSFNNVLQSEKARVDYDDVAYIYRTYYIKKVLDSLNINGIIENLKNDNNKYFMTVGKETNLLFESNESNRILFEKILTDFDVKQIIILKKANISNLKKCKSADDSNNICNSYFTELTEDMREYIKTVDIDIKCDNVLAVEFENCKDSEKCYKFYSWVSV